MADGDYILCAKAFDAAGNLGVSGNITVTVHNSSTDIQIPVVNITSPLPESIVSGTIRVNFNYADNCGVKYIDLYVDGNHVLTAYDEAGNLGLSPSISFNIMNLR